MVSRHIKCRRKRRQAIKKRREHGKVREFVGQIAGQGDEIRTLQAHQLQQVPALCVKAPAVQIGDLHDAQPGKRLRQRCAGGGHGARREREISNHAAPASTSAAGSSQRLCVLPRFSPAYRTLLRLDCRYFNTFGPQRKAKRRVFAPGPSGSCEKSVLCAAGIHFCIVIFGLKCYNSRKRKIMDVHWN